MPDNEIVVPVDVQTKISNLRKILNSVEAELDKITEAVAKHNPEREILNKIVTEMDGLLDDVKEQMSNSISYIEEGDF